MNRPFAGYGYYRNDRPFSNVLRETTFEVLSESQCLSRNLYHQRRNIKNLFFCAGHVNERTWTCKGDSGSPLIKETNSSSYKVIGVLHGSKSKSCGNTKVFPSMFANIEHHKNLRFINQWKYTINELKNGLQREEDITKVVNYTKDAAN